MIETRNTQTSEAQFFCAELIQLNLLQMEVLEKAAKAEHSEDRKVALLQASSTIYDVIKSIIN